MHCFNWHCVFKMLFIWELQNISPGPFLSVHTKWILLLLNMPYSERSSYWMIVFLVILNTLQTLVFFAALCSCSYIQVLTILKRFLNCIIIVMCELPYLGIICSGGKSLFSFSEKVTFSVYRFGMKIFFFFFAINLLKYFCIFTRVNLIRNLMLEILVSQPTSHCQSARVSNRRKKRQKAAQHLSVDMSYSLSLIRVTVHQPERRKLKGSY